MTTKSSIAILTLCCTLFLLHCVPPIEPEKSPLSNEIFKDSATVAIKKIDISETTGKVVKTKQNTLSSKIPETKNPLKLKITNLSSKSAPLILRIYQSKHRFMDRNDRHKEYTFLPKSDTFFTNIHDIEYGEYALAIYQDLNSNGVNDKNIIGMPTEAYALSNNIIPKLRIPTYKDCKFIYSKKNNDLILNLQSQ